MEKTTMGMREIGDRTESCLDELAGILVRVATLALMCSVVGVLVMALLKLAGILR